jgi:glycosyltransferase involved in cell wall biosynthesis
MKISAHTYVRNGLTYLYPFLQSIQSVLPLVDEFVVVIGDSNDGTREAVVNLNSNKVRIVDTVWDMNLREGGKIFAQQANAGLDAVTGDWVIHIQADEVLHENDLPKLKEYILRFDKDTRVDALLFPFLNFRGDYNHIHTGRKSHRFEIRAFRRDPLIRSYRDSQGFRRFSSNEAYEQGEKGEKLRVIKIDVPIYHYSYVRPPQKMKEKAQVWEAMYINDDQKLAKRYENIEVDYNVVDKLEPFRGTHPKIMEPVIQKKDWNFVFDPSKFTSSFRHRILNRIEELTGRRIGEYKNYKIVGKI